MTDVYDATWYDEVMVEQGSPAMLPLEDSPWLDVYQCVARLIEPHEEVVDLGCGTGRFIALLRQRLHTARITGVDWSHAALGEAEFYNRAGSNHPVWSCEDLAAWRPDGLRAGNTVYTCTEVLEHLDDDLGLVRRVPPGHRFIFSVPAFESQSHVRTFPRVGDLWERYAALLTFRSWSLTGTDLKSIHVVETTRRADAW